MDENIDDKPVTQAYLREVLSKVDKSLQEFSGAIKKLQKTPSQSSSKTADLSLRIDQIERKMSEVTGDDKRDDYNQDVLKQEFKRIETRIEQLERAEKHEEYDQNTLERNVSQLQQEIREIDRKLRDINYKLRKLS